MNPVLIFVIQSVCFIFDRPEISFVRTTFIFRMIKDEHNRQHLQTLRPIQPVIGPRRRRHIWSDVTKVDLSS